MHIIVKKAIHNDKYCAYWDDGGEYDGGCVYSDNPQHAVQKLVNEQGRFNFY